jgi:hypothetical protein
MIRKLLILAFIIAVVSNALAARSPHIDGDGGCSMACCQAARESQDELNLSGLCCVMDCKQPADTTNLPSPLSQLNTARYGKDLNMHLPCRLDVALFASSANFSHSSTQNSLSQSNLYLEISTLLI